MTDPVVNGPDTTERTTPKAPAGGSTNETAPPAPTERAPRAPRTVAKAASDGSDTAASGSAERATVAKSRSGDGGDGDGDGDNPASGDTSTSSGDGGDGGDARPKPRRRGSRGGRSRARTTDGDESSSDASPSDASPSGESASDATADAKSGPTARTPRPKSPRPAGKTAAAAKSDPTDDQPELPDRPGQAKARTAEAAERALVRKPQIGDTRPAQSGSEGDDDSDAAAPAAKTTANRRRRGGRGGAGNEQTGASGGGGRGGRGGAGRDSDKPAARDGGGRSGGGRGRGKAVTPIEAMVHDGPVDLDDADMEKRRGRERKGRPVGRYLMCVSKGPKATQIAILEGRNLIEHYVARPSDDIAQIHGNIYLGRVQNVLPGMEAAFIDIGTPKNAVLYRGDVQYDAEDIEQKGDARIEQILKARQTILCQVTKNPIAHKGARLTQEVSLPGRFVVLIPNSTTYGISKRLADDERKRLRSILDKVRPKGHGLIVRTAADGVTAEEIERDMLSLSHQWEQIEALAQKTQAPALLYREPDMAVRVIREELNQNYRGIYIDDAGLYEEVRSYVNAISPALVDRVQHYDTSVEPLSIFERHHVHEQLHRALDRKVWLPSGGSLIIEHTEALTVIDVNTGKNVGSKSLEETVYKNNLEAADEIAKQLRLRDIGGIIVIDFIDMEIENNRKVVIKAFRDALARDKTRTQVFDISDLGLVEMTRKRIGEGLLESFTSQCPECEGRGLLIDQDMLI